MRKRYAAAVPKTWGLPVLTFTLLGDLSREQSGICLKMHAGSSLTRDSDVVLRKEWRVIGCSERNISLDGSFSNSEKLPGKGVHVHRSFSLTIAPDVALRE